ncbi:aldo/keto reductase [Marinomonas fungiae]|uniref:aldo/keto reductase n=1 Tax=Marinomonas fungiae TaxID=1137284 RepID=UPI003A8E41F5
MKLLAKSGKRESQNGNKVAALHVHIRDNMSLNRRNIHDVTDTSLERLQTDYIDSYQLHWPQRQTNCFDN